MENHFNPLEKGEISDRNSHEPSLVKEQTHTQRARA